jgi:hypothetical protein
MLCFYLQDYTHILHQLDTLDGRLAELLAEEKQQKIDQLA